MPRILVDNCNTNTSCNHKESLPPRIIKVSDDVDIKINTLTNKLKKEYVAQNLKQDLYKQIGLNDLDDIAYIYIDNNGVPSKILAKSGLKLEIHWEDLGDDIKDILNQKISDAINAETLLRISGDAETLAAAKLYTDKQVAKEGMRSVNQILADDVGNVDLFYFNSLPTDINFQKNQLFLEADSDSYPSEELLLQSLASVNAVNNSVKSAEQLSYVFEDESSSNSTNYVFEDESSSNSTNYVFEDESSSNSTNYVFEDESSSNSTNYVFEDESSSNSTNYVFEDESSSNSTNYVFEDESSSNSTNYVFES